MPLEHYYEKIFMRDFNNLYNSDAHGGVICGGGFKYKIKI